MAMKLQGKSALVTGAGRGIGRAIALRLAREGADVTVNDINEQNAVAVAKEIESTGRRAQPVVADVTNTDQIEEMVNRHREMFGGLDILINNAGIVVVKSLFEHTVEDWERVLRIDLTSIYLCCRAAAPIMIAQKSGKIINTASMGGIRAQPLYAAYCAAKAGVISLTESLSKELIQHNIQVNAVCPGIIDTEMWVHVDREGSSVTGIPSYMESRVATVGMKRPGTPDEVAAMYAFLASSDADYITGEAFKIHGGV